MIKSQKKKILVVEDDKHIAEGLKLNLTLQGYSVEIAETGVLAIQKWKEIHPALIVLDIMLPGIDGISVLQSIRLEDERLPILVLSAKGALNDRVKGFKHGADDYMVKPFELEEFLLRIKRLLTRGAWNNSETDKNLKIETDKNYSFGKNYIDFHNCVARCYGGTIDLTEQEVKLLKLFIANRGKSLSRKKLLEIGWGYTENTATRTVDNFMVRFRKYFEDNPKKPIFFKSKRAVGYIFDYDKE
ncbi:MAG: DNA-binding response regulator [Desulfobacteraceae bacterium 4572_19]|nr:MAG: DNA-binding response regulator [Desulfobacteraceae bacterium 4572_19]